VTRESAGLATLEGTSPLLRERLAALAAAPSVDGYLAVASAYRTYGVHDRAFDYLIDGLGRYPRQAALHDAVARMWRDWGLPDRALRHAHLAARYAPASAETHNTLGTVLWALSAREAAAHAFARAVALDAGAAYALHNLCLAAAALGHVLPPACPAPRPADGSGLGPPP
jgi:Flp pilus assembly protein TadD